MSAIAYQVNRQIPVTHTVDVAVVGGGPGGVGAAVMAARNGASVLLIERDGYLGGMAAAGEVHPFMPNHADATCLDKPVYIDWIRAMQAYLPEPLQATEAEVAEAQPRARLISKDVAMLAAEDICLEAGCQLLYHHQLVDVVLDGRDITALVLASKSGYTAVRAKMVVDCTGDGDAAALAGNPFEKGGPSGNCQPMTLCFKLGNVDQSRTPDRKTITERYVAAKERGEIECPREDVLAFGWLRDDVVHFNTTRVVGKDATNGIDLSQAEIMARRQVRQYLTFFRREIPGFEQAEIHSVAHHIGVRESRRITGLACVTREDFRACRRFPDAIARVNYPIDIHNPDGTGTEHERLPSGAWYEIPYGCIVARDVTNLLIGGRPISVDHAVHSSMRVMPPACSVGQAAGLAAALAAARGVSPGELAGTDVREALIANGAWLAEV